ncbi:MAG: hypothetical protein K0R81_2776 [Microbacterium sp.]|jgi:GrpB-like predicted nucleotidyltransferase (UPF0157 family)|nr:hypothetical protein [Microbacterium sp.]
MVRTHPLWLPFAPGANHARQGARVAHRQTEPGALQRPRGGVDEAFETVAARIRDALGSRALLLGHVGSTAVPGLLAKPVIDIDLTVSAVDEEDGYLPALERCGFRLIFRDEMAGSPHRHLTLAMPNTNLHVWEPGAIEPARHALFVEWLRAHPEDAARYSAAKLDAAASPGRYNDAKAAAVYDIYERVFANDPRHAHDPHPRPPGGGEEF